MKHVNRLRELCHVHCSIRPARIVRAPARPFPQSRATSSRFHASAQFALDRARNRASVEPQVGNPSADQASRQAKPTCAGASASQPLHLLYAKISIKCSSRTVARTVAASEMAQCDLYNRLTRKGHSRHLSQRLLPVTSEVAGSSPVVPANSFSTFLQPFYAFTPRRAATPGDTNRHQMP